MMYSTSKQEQIPPPEFRSIRILNHRVHFSHQPYQQQVQVVRRVLHGLRSMRHVALELPTGCGKTMALLCSLAAFQLQQCRELKEEAQRAVDRESVAPSSGSADSPRARRRSPSEDNDDEDDKVKVRTEKRQRCSPARKSHLQESRGCSCHCSMPTDIEDLNHCAESDDDFEWFVVPKCRLRSASHSVRGKVHQREPTGIPLCFAGACGNSGSRKNPGGAGNSLAQLPTSASQTGVKDGVYAPGAVLGKCAPGTWEQLAGNSVRGISGQPVGNSLLGTSEGTADLSQPGREKHPGGREHSRGMYGPTLLTAAEKQASRNCPVRVCTIYYTSRTHTQLRQVCRELKSSPYRDATAVVLSSREQSCVHPDGNAAPSKTVLCNSLHSEDYMVSRCRFHDKVDKVRRREWRDAHGLPTIMDMDTMVTAGQRNAFCPYFAARELVGSSHFVFCPVNYIIDPLVRRSTGIELRGDVVVFDEAHTLDDLCREVASVCLSTSEMEECCRDCGDDVCYADIVSMYCCLIKFISLFSCKAKVDTCSREKRVTYSGMHLVSRLAAADVTEVSVHRFKAVTEQASLASHDPSSAVSLDPHTLSICERTALVLTYVFSRPEAYTCAIVMMESHQQRSVQVNTPGWFHRNVPTSQPVTSCRLQWGLRIHCQRASVVFGEVSSRARAVVLASATLSPFVPLQRELGIDFGESVSTAHVIPSERMWISVVVSGPNLQPLSGGYVNAKNPQYLQEVGLVVLDVCRRVPFGVLVFVPSYTLLDNLVACWRQGAVWEQLQLHKVPMLEVRGTSAFVNTIAAYHAEVEAARLRLSEGTATVGVNCTGPIMLAVMRGKIAEGYNFADDLARAVLTVGIPFPNIADSTVSSKVEYNTKNVQEMGINGSLWLEQTAIKCLNQALGRGLRHTKDWCAVLLLENRILSQKYCNYLPPWLFERMHHFGSYQGQMAAMSGFVQDMMGAGSG